MPFHALLFRSPEACNNLRRVLQSITGALFWDGVFSLITQGAFSLMVGATAVKRAINRTRRITFRIPAILRPRCRGSCNPAAPEKGRPMLRRQKESRITIGK